MSRTKGSKNKRPSKNDLLDLSIETLHAVMAEFILKIKTDSLSHEQKLQLSKLYSQYKKVLDSKWSLK